MKKYDVDYSKIPEHMREGAELYVEKGLKPGDFLMAVLENKLVEAFAKADITNQLAMFEWAKFLHGEMPFGAWGSEEKVEAWMKEKRGEVKT